MKKMIQLIGLVLIALLAMGCVTNNTFTLTASEPAATISVNGVPVGSVYTAGGSPIQVKITHPDYDEFDTTLKPQKGIAFGMSSANVGLVVGTVLPTLMGAIFLVVNNTVGSPYAATSFRANANGVTVDTSTFTTMNTIGTICLGIGGGFAALGLIPVTTWEKSYRFDISGYSLYDLGGYNKKTGFDKFGVNRKGLFINGDRFDGKVVGAKKVGWGTYTPKDGAPIFGLFDSDRLTGIAIETMPDGSQFFGTWKDGKKDGTGVLVKTDGHRNLQTWSAGTLAQTVPAGTVTSSQVKWIFFGAADADGLAQGPGDAVSTDLRARIEGATFLAGNLQRGVLIQPDGTRLEGSFQNGQLVSGRIVLPGGAVYSGDLENGTPNGKGNMTLADGTKYTGDFKDGKFDGQGVITRPNGEKYEGGFKDGQPHGLGIYFNGERIERCEYYQGKRIDQAYLIHQENERNLAALRDEREKAAKDKADQAEQARIAQERQAAEQKAATERSSNNLIAGLFGIGAALAGSSVGMNTSQALNFGIATAADVAADNASMSGSKAAANKALQEHGVNPNQAASSSSPANSGSSAQAGAFEVVTMNLSSGPVKVTHDLSHCWEDLSRYLGEYRANGGNRAEAGGGTLSLNGNGTGTLIVHRDAKDFELPAADSNTPLNFTWGILLDDSMKPKRSADTGGYWGNALIIVVKRTSPDEAEDAWTIGTLKGSRFLAEGMWVHAEDHN